MCRLSHKYLLDWCSHTNFFFPEPSEMKQTLQSAAPIRRASNGRHMAGIGRVCREVPARKWQSEEKVARYEPCAAHKFLKHLGTINFNYSPILSRVSWFRSISAASGVMRASVCIWTRAQHSFCLLSHPNYATHIPSFASLFSPHYRQSFSLMRTVWTMQKCTETFLFKSFFLCVCNAMIFPFLFGFFAVVLYNTLQLFECICFAECNLHWSIYFLSSVLKLWRSFFFSSICGSYSHKRWIMQTLYQPNQISFKLRVRMKDSQVAHTIPNVIIFRFQWCCYCWCSQWIGLYAKRDARAEWACVDLFHCDAFRW